MKEEKCRCLEILNRDCGGDLTRIYIHLMGCPEDLATKEYDVLPWYKKIFQRNPRHYYK